MQYRDPKTVSPRVSDNSFAIIRKKKLFLIPVAFRIMSYDKSDPSLTQFWAKLSLTLFDNVKLLFEQIETQHAARSPDDGLGAQMAVCPAQVQESEHVC